MSIQSISRCFRRAAVLLPMVTMVACQPPEDALIPDGEVAAPATAELVQLAPSITPLPAARDTSIRMTAPNINYARDATLDVNRTLVAFDQAAVQAALGPQDYLVSAELELTLTSNSLRRRLPVRTVAAHRLTKAWTEAGATWNCAVDSNPTNNRADCSGATAWSMGVLPPNPFASPATAQATIAPTQTGTVRFNVTADVRGFLAGSTQNHGWMLRSGLLGVFAEFADFASRETSTPPRLLLTIRRCSPTICNDGNACTVDICDSQAVCQNLTAPDGTICNDGNACTLSDTCQAGACTGASPVVCDALDQCHVAGVCNPATGQCTHPVAPNGTACDDSNACTRSDTCQAGGCNGSDPVICTAQDQCHVAGVCNTSTGQCTNPNAADGTGCNDGNMCSAGDMCQAGTCLAGATDTCAVPPVVINEIESNGGTPGDWVELYNRGSAPVNLSGYIFRDNADNDPTHNYVIPAGTVIAPGGYLTLEEAQFGFGLGSPDSARLFMPNGTTVVDSHAWTPHAAPTYGRCPNGTGGFVTMSSVTKGAANDCSVQVVINEIESDMGVPNDWVELYNKGPNTVDLSGFVFKDNADTNGYLIPAGTTLAPGAYLVLENAAFGFGLGSGDSARLFMPDNSTLVDSHTWTAHAATTYGRCPNGTGGFVNTSGVTKGAVNNCGFVPPPVVINEVESDGGSPGDWVELFNRGTAPVDLAGFIFRDSGNSPYVLPANSIVPPGGYLVMEVAQFIFGLGGADSARLSSPDDTVVIDSFSWTEHAPATTYGRCPNGTGATFATTVTVTKGAANDCAGFVNFVTWPGGAAVTTIDTVGAFTSNLSGLTYQPATPLGPGTLWAVTNGPSTLYRLEAGPGGTWVNSAAPDWGAGKTLLYPDGMGIPDSEGVTRGVPTSSDMYVATERSNLANTVSRMSVLRFDSSTPGTALTAVQEWNLTPSIPPVADANLGLEAITWVPDNQLVMAGFLDENLNQPYNPASYPAHGGGVFFVGVEATGVIHAYVLDHTSSNFFKVATIVSGQTGVMGLEFDADTGNLWSWCDNTCGNRATLLAITPTSNGRFVLRAGYERPAGMGNFNNEGIAFAPVSECSGGLRSFFWCDDSDSETHSLRMGTLNLACPAP